MNRDRLRLAAEGDAPARCERPRAVLEQAARRLGREQLLAELARRVLHPGRDVDRVADHADLDEPPAADRPHDDQPGVDPEPDPAAAAEARRGTA